MSGEHPEDEHDADHVAPRDHAPDDAGTSSDAGSQARSAGQTRPGPAPHRPGLWLAVFMVVVGLTVLVTIIGVVTDDGRTTGASSAAASPAVS